MPSLVVRYLPGIRMSISPLSIQFTSFEQLRKLSSGGYLYALLDGYDAPALPSKVEALGKEKAASLFLGEGEKAYWALAPYVICVEEATLEWIRQTLWGTVSGVFVMSKSGLETLRNHLRRFLIVQLPDGERWFFRYYDPRILKIYLEHCRPDELEIFFGPVRGFGIVDQQENRVVLLHLPPASSSIWTPASSGAAWLISREQYEALTGASRGDLEARILHHLEKLSPQRFAGLGEPEVRELVRQALAKAGSYRLHRETDLCSFVELSFAFGVDFDENPVFPWARETLQDASLGEPSVRLSRVLELAKVAVARAAGTTAS